MKQLVCIFLCSLLMLLPLCSVTVSAEQVLTVSLPQVQEKAGEAVELPITITNNPGIISVKVELSYNTSLLTLENAKGGVFQGVSFGPLTNSSFTVNWMDSLHGNNTTNGILAVLTFRVNKTAKAGEIPVTLSANPVEIFDNDFNPQPFRLINGAVKVQGEEPPPAPPISTTPTDTVPPTNTNVAKVGDVNADGKINAKDALAVLKIAVGKMTPTPLQQQLANVNWDAFINAKDALEILKYSVNKPSCLGN